jgi:hypothetical protein
MRRNHQPRYNNSECSWSHRRPDQLMCHVQDGRKAWSAIYQGFCLQHGTTTWHESCRSLGTSRHQQNHLSGSVCAAAHHADINILLQFDSSHEFKDTAGRELFTDAYPAWEKEAGLMRHWTEYIQRSFSKHCYRSR